MNLPTDLQNDPIEVFDKIREQKIGNKYGEYDCANDEALKWIEEAFIKNEITITDTLDNILSGAISTLVNNGYIK